MPVKKGLFARFGMWLIPLGCLAVLLVCGGMVTIVGTMIFSMLRNAEPCQEAVRRAEGNTVVVDALGTPIKQGWVVRGSIVMQNNDGQANLEVPIWGPKGRGTVHVVASRRGGVWFYSEMDVAIEGRTEHVNLLPGSTTRPTTMPLEPASRL
jgi:hypothetical protein